MAIKKKKRTLSDRWGVTYEMLGYYLGVGKQVYAMRESSAERGLPLLAAENEIALTAALDMGTPVTDLPVYAQRLHAHDAQLPEAIHKALPKLTISIHKQRERLESMQQKHADALRRMHAANVLLSGKGQNIRPLTPAQKEWLLLRYQQAESQLEANNPSTIALQEAKVNVLEYEKTQLEQLLK